MERERKKQRKRRSERMRAIVYREGERERKRKREKERERGRERTHAYEFFGSVLLGKLRIPDTSATEIVFFYSCSECAPNGRCVNRIR